MWDFLIEWGGLLGVLFGVLGPNFAAYWRQKDTFERELDSRWARGCSR